MTQLEGFFSKMPHFENKNTKVPHIENKLSKCHTFDWSYFYIYITAICSGGIVLHLYFFILNCAGNFWQAF
jgi:hypothetical protein